MKTRICVLAALLAVAGTAWADKTAYWTARYGGWSKEHSCRHTKDGRACWTLTIGKDPWNQEVSDLTYSCWADGGESLTFGFWTAIVVKTANSTLTVRWDSGHEESLETQVETGEYRGKPQYWFHIANPQAFLQRAENHDRLTVTLPVRDIHGRFVKDKYQMQNMRRSIAATMRECGITASMLGEFP